MQVKDLSFSSKLFPDFWGRRGRRTHSLPLRRSSRRASTNPSKETATDATCSKNYSQVGLPRGEYFPFVLTLSRNSGVLRPSLRCFFLPTKFEKKSTMTPGGISDPMPFPSQFLLVLLLDLLRLISTQLMTHNPADCLRLLLSRPLVRASPSVVIYSLVLTTMGVKSMVYPHRFKAFLSSHPASHSWPLTCDTLSDCMIL